MHREGLFAVLRKKKEEARIWKRETDIRRGGGKGGACVSIFAGGEKEKRDRN